MNRIRQIVKTACAVLVLLTPLQAADGLTIKGGAFTYAAHTGRVVLNGTSGMRLDASVSSSSGVMGPDEQCGFSECEPGTTVVTLNATWSGTDFTGTLRLRGQEYTLGLESADGALGRVNFSGSVEVPAAVGPDPIEVSAPFTMTGSVAHGQGADGSPIVESMRGGGTATLTFTPNVNQSAWQFVSADYVFD